MSEPCPRADQHTPAPTLYLAWSAWAGAMSSRGWQQRRCPGCGKYRIWTGTRTMPALGDFQVDCFGRPVRES